MSGFAMDLLFVKTISVSIDCIVIKYLIFFSEKNIFNNKHTVEHFLIWSFIIVSRENELLCCLVSIKI